MMEIGPVATYCYMGYCKSPEPFIFFSHVIVFFPLIVFPSAGFTPWPKDSHERGKGKGKGRVKEGKRKNRKGTGKGEEREKQGRVSHRPFLMPKVIVFVLLSFVNPVHVPFFWKWLQSSKKDCSDHLPGTFLVQRIWHAFVGAPLRQQTMKWRNQKH